MAAQRAGVTVEGRFLSREAIEKAYQELQAPEFNAGDRVRYKGGHSVNDEFIVVAASVAEAHRQYWSDVISKSNVVLVGLTDGNSYSPSPNFIEHVPVKR